MAWVVSTNASLFASGKELNVLSQLNDAIPGSFRVGLRVRSETVVLDDKGELRTLIGMLQATLDRWGDES
jgi:hypothetical protein